jgi:hypothetical protein
VLSCFRDAGHAVGTLRLSKRMIDLDPPAPPDAANDL